MAFLPECQAIKKAFSALGVDQKLLVETFGNLKEDDLKEFKGSTPCFTGAGSYHRIADYDGDEKKHCYLHLNRALELWTQHPFERDARLLKFALEQEVFPKMVFVELCCTRTFDDFIGMKMAYATMYKISVEQELHAYFPFTFEHKFLKEMLVDSPYETSDLNIKERAEIDSEKLFKTLRCHIRDDEKRVIDLIVHDSQGYTEMVFQSYKEMYNVEFEQDMEEKYEIITAILECRFNQASYFCKLLESAFATNNEDTLTRVIVTRADVDMEDIKKAFLKKTGIPLDKKVEGAVHGNYKEFLLTLIRRSD